MIRQTKNMAASVRAKLLTLSRETGQSFQELVQFRKLFGQRSFTGLAHWDYLLFSLRPQFDERFRGHCFTST